MGPVGVTTGCLWCSDLFMYVEIIRLPQRLVGVTMISNYFLTANSCHLVRIKRWPVSPYCDTFDVLHVDEHLAPPIYCGHLSHLYLGRPYRRMTRNVYPSMTDIMKAQSYYVLRPVIRLLLEYVYTTDPSLANFGRVSVWRCTSST